MDSFFENEEGCTCYHPLKNLTTRKLLVPKYQ